MTISSASSSTSNFHFWQQWLVIANVIFTIFGVLVAFAGDTILFELHNQQSLAVFFDGQPMTEQMLTFKKFLFGIIGGTIAGFHLLMVFVAKNGFKNKEKWAYQCVLYGTLLWFVIDTSLSLYYGAWHNVAMVNLVAFVGIGLPLWKTRKAFFGRE